MLPYYAFLAIPRNGPISNDRNGKIDKRSLASLAESGNSDGFEEVIVPNRPLQNPTQHSRYPGTPQWPSSFKMGRSWDCDAHVRHVTSQRSSTLDFAKIYHALSSKTRWRERKDGNRHTFWMMCEGWSPLRRCSNIGGYNPCYLNHNTLVPFHGLFLTIDFIF